jgi:multiple sugar transport system permease protein
MYAALITVLTLGGVTMIYPFIIMVSGTVRSEMDATDLDLMPGYMASNEVLYKKFLETKYNQGVEFMNMAHGRQHFSFKHKDVKPPELVQQQIDDFRRFLDEFDNWPRHWDLVGASMGVKTVPENVRELTQRLRKRYKNDLTLMRQDLGVANISWDFRGFQPPKWIELRYEFEPNAIYEELFAIEDESDWAERQILSVSGHFVQTMILPTYSARDPQPYNKAHTVNVDKIDDYVLSRTVPGEDQPQLRKEWIEFVNKELNPAFTTLKGVSDEKYQVFLRDKYDDAEGLNRSWATQYTSLDQVKLPRKQWLSGSQRLDYTEFFRAQSADHYLLVAPEYAWQDWLKSQYTTIADLNQAHQTDYADFAHALMPVMQIEWQHVQSNTTQLRWTYAVRNYINVYDAMFVQGRAFFNTSLLCLLTIITALLINPLAAYAMSRFRLPGTYKFLLILMATMSFPPMVTMIPTFIMLREMNFLNSFWALVLPGAANGYMIFLLKGFFDSLPQDLYEAALIDGAGEFRMFFQITMALSKPILAVVALGAFTGAYTMFLYALIVCPDEDMWLLNVYLLQYQSQVSMGGMFAAVLLAAIPPLVIFLFAQNIIMRGIVVPVEK